MPSSSARCAQFPRAQDKVHFYIKLRELRDELRGVIKSKEVEEVKYTFDLGLAKGTYRTFMIALLNHTKSDVHTIMDCIWPLLSLAEDAKRIAVKEEQYDPGYEAAFGGAYGDSAPEGGQSNGFCNFSTSEETGW